MSYEPSGMRLSDSSDRTYGNYGHEYNIFLDLNNPSATTRTISLSFAHRVVGGNSPSHTFNAPMLINGSRVMVFTTPSSPKDTLLSQFRISPGDTKTISIRFFAPGLLTTGHQLILEAL